MKLKDMKLEELELYTYTDIAEMVLNESKNPLKTTELFQKICDLLELSQEQYALKIGDFYTSLTTDKRFIALENALWDLRDRHAIEIVVSLDDDEDEDAEESESDEDEEIKEDEDDIDTIIDDDVDDDDDIEDLSIVTEDEIEEN